ncbi:MAG: alanine--tRNA ligase [Chloroflexi bacterium]|nr:alanine--tRNA ligase [Chloroflexota bacterium]
MNYSELLESGGRKIESSNQSILPDPAIAMPEQTFTADEVREQFLKFFEDREHLRLPSASLIPAGDPTLLLTTAGMVPFKAYFSGELTPPSPRITTAQKSFRTTDIEEVGDVSHLTLFEMLGNFSFGDYFKTESCKWALDLCLDVYGMDFDRIYPTVYLNDDEAYEIWRDLGVPAERISRLGDEDNWWGPAGDEGACGPCSELNYYLGDFDDLPPTDSSVRGTTWGPGISDDFLEFYNLVFTQYYRDRDGNDELLPKKNIDTGMGFERTCQILQGKSNVYETDVFTPLIELVANRARLPYGETEDADRAIRVVAEHGRSASFLISDGVVPGNTGRGYVLRRVIRRGMLFGRELGLSGPILPQIAEATSSQMSHVYPELASNLSFVQHVLQREEESFETTLDQGSRMLEEVIAEAKTSGRKSISGAAVVRLYDTYGFPFEMTAEVSAEQDMNVDFEAVETEMDQLRERSRRSATMFDSDTDVESLYRSFGIEEVPFLGHRTLIADVEVIGIVKDGKLVDNANEGEVLEIVLAETPFYAARGGQIGDSGWMRNGEAKVRVDDCQAPYGHLNVHSCEIESGNVAIGDVLTVEVDGDRREKIRRNHTATHLVHSALREVLGTHVRQSGSLVAPDYLRFDFTHMDALTADEIREVQDRVNLAIRKNIPVDVHWTTYGRAVEEGALAFFGDTYEHDVRTIKIDAPWSYELCGGTHMDATGGIGTFVIVSQTGIGSGIRRIEALTGVGAEQEIQRRFGIVDTIAAKLRVEDDRVVGRTDDLLAELDEARRLASQLEEQLLRRSVDGDSSAAEDLDFNLAIGSSQVPVQVRNIPASNVDAMRRTGDHMRDRLGSGIVVLGSVVGERPVIIVMATSDIAGKHVHAGNIAKSISATIGGGGGGRPDSAQAGARDPSRIDEALQNARSVIESVSDSAKQTAG